ncbi:MAG TPA: sulfatase-like hydrolase/transferase, partial [Chloroflexota bacterium]|nr:sulfatase-like hydrolase/transferase [Chloroflexota bacterium]
VPVVSAADAALGSSEQIEKTIDGRADVTNAAVFDWLEKNVHSESAPFFLWVHYFDPHYPYTPPAGYDHLLGLKYSGRIDGSVDAIHAIEKKQVMPTPEDRARLLELYQGEIAFTDAQVGLLLKKLEDGGLLDDTIVVATGDHGESFGEHDDWTHGLKVFEPEVRVPLLLRYPRRVSGRTVVDAPVQSIDLLPTLLDLTGIKPSAELQGKSLLPLLNGSSDGKDRVAFTELADEAFVSMLSYQEWKLTRNNANDELQLYHLSNDAGEQKNLAADQPALTRELHARLLDMMKVSGVSK